MKVFPDFKIQNLLPHMQVWLDRYRVERNFSGEAMLQAKAQRINAYFTEYGLNTAVIAISGGVDSALVLALMKYASEQPGSPLKNVVPVTLPAIHSSGVTGQFSSRARSEELCEALGLDFVTLDISNVVAQLSQGVENSIGVSSEDWAKGQLVSYMRTPALYYYTTLFTEQGQHAVLVGTTNADEGQYIGYIGKASDGMVDIQPISDLHKSEVYQLSSMLGVPNSILSAIPTGDMYDSRVDEEVFGFPYGFVELYRYFMLLSDAGRDEFMLDLERAGESEVFQKLSANLEDMHKYNKHKYLGCSPAVHLDVINTKVPGGWKYYNFGDE
ncbi:MAG: NAD(+) synthase [Hafnia sp.]